VKRTLIALLLFAAAPAAAQEPVHADFDDGWAARWMEVELAGRANRFNAVREGDNAVLMAVSERAASALWHSVDLHPGAQGMVTWRWKVDGALNGNDREREKKGDDYAARFFVIFNAEPFSREARAICYVWASSEPPGATFRNPYFDNVQTIVLRSGDEHAGRWLTEERDFVSDYLEAFGEQPLVVSAVAVMVDTDDTGGRATAWFDEITIERW
jgi:hypothetical protein